MMSFDGKTVVVTGGSSGIGRAAAIAFARAGANVVVAGRSRETKAGDFGEVAHLSVVDLLQAEGRRAIFVQADVTVAGDMRAVADHAVQVFGSVDIWVNNAGVVAPPSPFWTYDDADFDRCLDVNCRGLWNGMRAATHQMLRQERRGVIVNMLSTAAIRPHAGQSVYNISKAAAAQATRCAALELGPLGIRVNGVCPTVVRTAISRDFVESPEFRQWFRTVAPLGEPVDSEDVVAAILFLAGDAAARITGILMPVDSGEALGPPAHELKQEIQVGAPEEKTSLPLPTGR
ncbi:glucose 1-dehydrogenase [Sphingobium sp. Sx8-8]|uniref:SDR family NAD(P)-dependent oxidoreductase n=1 Tax=Sphingobium sp. Sx8-8 TaxID=2933617 RepID=UPI001F59B0FD|nr:glucose 1-dehydrogenase [Sphingobium sp. Sx8-8]